MNEQHQKLYQQIQDYSLDQPEDPFPFTKRLARENGWSLDYPQQAIAEYKKNIFLAMVQISLLVYLNWFVRLGICT